MFEKKSEDYALKTHCASCWQKDADGEYACTGLEYCNRHKDWQKGAEFGYNKANEWHYPSKGEYPIDKTEMLVYFKYADYEYPCKTFGFYNGHFWDTKRGDVSNKEVIAWKEIVLPKEV